MSGTADQESTGAENIRAVKKYLETLAQGDADGFSEVVDPGAVLRVPDSLPFGGTYKGWAGFQQGFAAFSETWEAETSGHEFIAGEETVIVLLRIKGLVKSTGREIEVLVAEVFKLHNGKVTEVSPFYFDTAKMLEAMRSFDPR